MKIVNLFCFVFVFLFSNSLIAQNSTFQWAYQLNVSEKAIAIDTNGSVLRTGGYFGTVDLDPEVGMQNFTSAGLFDIYIEKIDTNGHLLWVKSIGSSGDDLAQSITTDTEGNVYVAGIYGGTVDFDPGVGVFNMSASGNNNIFILKLNSNGDFIWAKSNKSGNSGSAKSIDVDSLGYIYLTGTFQGICDFDPGPSVRNIASNGYSDFYVQRLDPDGNLVYAKGFGGVGTEYTHSIKTDGNGNAYVGGGFQFTVDFDPGVDTLNLSAIGIMEAFILKLGGLGELQWVKQIDSKFTFLETCFLDLDHNGDIYSIGHFNDVIDANPDTGVFNLSCVGNQDIYMLKLNTNGQFVWAKQIGGGGDIQSWGLQIMNNGDMYIAGGFSGPIDFDPGNGTTLLNAPTKYDSFIQKLNSNGDLLWVKQYEGIDTASLKTYDFIANEEGHLYSSGTFYELADFDPGAGVFTMYGDYTNGLNYLQKLRPCYLIQSVDDIEACDSYTWIDGNTYTQDNDTATYNYVGGAVNGCDSIVLLNLTINQTSGSTTNNIGSTIIANNNSASYVWLDCNNNYATIPGETMQSYTSIIGGSFAVELTENGCVDTSNCVSVASIGLIDNTFSSLYTIYPNPTQGEFTIEFNDKQ